MFFRFQFNLWRKGLSLSFFSTLSLIGLGLDFSEAEECGAVKFGSGGGGGIYITSYLLYFL